MVFGIDFDNTIVCYEGIFYKAACELGLIPRSCGKTKNEVRDYLRNNKKEDKWTELQGIVYGSRMLEAKPFPGVIDFFIKLHQHNIPCFIISHKTKFSKKGVKYNLHQAALDWLEENDFFDTQNTGILQEKVFFNATRSAKIYRIIECGCTHFIDDLPEMFEEPSFPENVEKILFDNYNNFKDSNLTRFDNWKSISNYLND